MPLEYDLRKTDLALRPNRFLLNSASVPVGSHKSHKWLMEGGTPSCGMGLPVHMEMGVQVSKANLSGKKKFSSCLPTLSGDCCQDPTNKLVQFFNSEDFNGVYSKQSFT